MAKITPIDVIKGISGKYGNKSNDYFATNSSSKKIRLAKLNNPYRGPSTEKQLAQQARFGARQAVATAWLNANKPSEKNGPKGTEAYRYVHRLKRGFNLSNITQVLYKYMNGSNVINLPDAANDAPPAEGKRMLTLSASPANGGTVVGAGEYDAGATAGIQATANAGYTFSRWSDGNTSASRSVVVNADMNLSAIFTANGGGGGIADGE